MKLRVFILFAILSFKGFGQYKSTKLKMAEGLLEEDKYYAALRVYKDIAEKEDENKYIVQKIAMIYEKLGQFELAEKWYLELLEIRQQEFPKTELKYALILKQLGKYKLAKEHFSTFSKGYRGFDKADVTRICKTNIKGCELALKSQIDNDYSAIALPKQINSTYNDLGPSFLGDTLIYSSVKADTAIFYSEFLDSIPLFKTYMIKKNEESWDSISKEFLPNILNSDKKHVANVAFSPDKDLMAFSKCKLNANGKMVCKIFASKKVKGQWLAPIKLSDEINDSKSDFSSTHPTFGIDPKSGRLQLYFSSNMPGGLGGYDLWKAFVKNDFTIEKLENLGRKINTIGDELTPNYSKKNQAFYFSSNGHIGFGGYDIYKCALKGRSKKFDKPVVLRRPINSSYNDWYFSPLNKKESYLVSNRLGARVYHKSARLDDIFLIKNEPKRFIMVNVFTNDSNPVKLNGANVSIKLASDNNAVNKVLASDSSYRIIPEKKYYILVQKNGYITQSKIFGIQWEEKKPVTELVFNLSKIDTLEELVIKNIYFDFDSHKLQDSSSIALNGLYDKLIENPQLIVEIGAHTDNKGSKEYNIDLSEKRAKSVVEYLLNKGIGKNRLFPKGYGAEFLISKSKEQSEQKVNRRITFKILSILEK